MMKSVVISHGDVDGITSGAIALLEFPNSTFYFSRPSQIHNDLYRIAKNRPAIVSVSDIAINEKRFPHILQALDKFPKSTEIYWTDHHPMSKKNQRELETRVNLFHQVGPCAAELAYRRFQEGLPEHALRLALYGAIGDYCDGTSFAINQFENYDKRTLYLEAGLLVQSLQEIDYKRKAKQLVQELTLGVAPSAMGSIVRLAMKATRIENDVFGYVKDNARKLGKVGYVLDMPIRGYRGKSAKFAAYLTESNIGISVKTDDDDVDMSLRRRRLKIDLNKALNTILPNLEDAHGGGHPGAAGASMSKNSFPTFLQRLDDYIDANFN
ncbi:MAG: DHHA1 domain-containing protein [Candidatus Thorarchaeota archaeon]|nr:DHHA1 domain-containing protein [Candidatus Thorarchaeota archaeon]